MTAEQEAIEKALEIACAYGNIDGAHHKMWVIDQMVRALCITEEEYESFLSWCDTPDYIEDEYYGEERLHHDWDTGIAP